MTPHNFFGQKAGSDKPQIADRWGRCKSCLKFFIKCVASLSGTKSGWKVDVRL